MTSDATDEALDAVLGLQFTVAWAGEGRCSPRRLGWWETDLVAEAGGGDRDRLRTLFFLGIELDEQLGDRLGALKRAGRPPAEALALPLGLGDEFSPEAFAAAVLSGAEDDSHAATAGAASFTTVPNGRQMKGAPPATPEVLVRRLAAALVPLAADYPMPFFSVGD